MKQFQQDTRNRIYIDGFYVRGSTVYRTGPPPECSKSLLLRMQVNLGLREKRKMYRPKVYGHSWNIYNFASYLWVQKLHNKREAVLNQSTSYSAVYNCNWNFSQTEGGCIKWHDKRFSFDSPLIWSWKPESRQTSHNSFWYKPGKYTFSFAQKKRSI